MKPDWDKLGEAFKDSTSVLIADVDCTSDEAKAVCSENDVGGYPTIMYFTDETGKKGEKYSGGRDYGELEKFVKQKLAKKCDAKTKENCDEQEVAYIDKMSSKDIVALTKEMERLQGMTGSAMKGDKKAWIMKRIAVLKGLTGAKSEL